MKDHYEMSVELFGIRAESDGENTTLYLPAVQWTAEHRNAVDAVQAAFSLSDFERDSICEFVSQMQIISQIRKAMKR